MVKSFHGTVTTVAAAVLMAWGASAVAQPTTQTGPATVWMMGEVHDNPDGHFFRIHDLMQALGQNWRPALVMEQFNTDRQSQLTHAWQTCKTADCVIKEAAAGNNWQWDLYKPLIDLALQYRLPLVAGNLSREQLREVMKSGYSAVFNQATIDKFGLNRPLPPAYLAAQGQAIDLGHCKMLDAKTIDMMVKGQVARDVNFALLTEQYAPQGVVLIAGNGHVRNDIGVLHWLPPSLASKVLISGYVEPTGADASLFDRIRIVDPFQRPDPCEAFKKTRAQ